MEYHKTLLDSQVMDENQEHDFNDWHKVDLINDEATNEGMRAIRYFAYRLHEAQRNLHL